MTTVLVVGSSGTVGLTLSSRLKALGLAVNCVSRVTPERLQELSSSVALTILCVPNEEAQALAPFVQSRVLDVSQAHRLDADWLYGLPEIHPSLSALISTADKVANPGCFATGGVLALRPIAAWLKNYPVVVTGIGGYSSGGNHLIKRFMSGDTGFRQYNLDQTHSHALEIKHHAWLTSAPMFLPGVAGHRQGTLVQVPVDLEYVGRSIDELKGRYRDAYAEFSSIRLELEAPPGKYLRPDEVQDSDLTILRVTNDPIGRKALISVSFDNLGKGAAGAAVQNTKLMLGI